MLNADVTDALMRPLAEIFFYHPTKMSFRFLRTIGFPLHMRLDVQINQFSERGRFAAFFFQKRILTFKVRSLECIKVRRESVCVPARFFNAGGWKHADRAERGLAVDFFEPEKRFASVGVYAKPKITDGFIVVMNACGCGLNGKFLNEFLAQSHTFRCFPRSHNRFTPGLL